MSTNNLKLSASVALTLAALLLAPSQAVAAEYWLKTGTTIFAAPDGAQVPMWGYASCTDGSGSTCTAVTVPGPALSVPAGETNLIVHLINTLPKPTSLVINGLIKPMVPVWNDGSTGARTSATQRVRSFDVEAAALTGTADYTWTNVKPGTYLYQSGTQPQVQVQMGLFGAVTSNALESTATAPAQAYTDISYDNQATLLFSEIDPALHAAIADGSYGTSPSPTSTFGYAPKYFLINGKPYVGTADSVISPTGGNGTTLLRLLNAGLTTHVPMIQGTHWTLIAEDGKKSPVNGKQYTALLPAAKTVDVLLTADTGGAIYPIMDRRLSLSNNGTSNGGMLAYLRFGATGGTQASTDTTNTVPVAGDDAYGSIKGVTLTVGARGVLVNDTDLDGLPQPLKAVAATGPTLNGATYTLNANGSFTYVPKVGFSGADSFTYSATDGKALSNAATVTIDVKDPGAPALTTLDDFNRAASVNLGSNWSQVSGGTPAEPNIQGNGTEAFAKATNLGGLAIWNTTINATTQGASFTASPLAGSGLVLKATGGTTSSPANYVRVRCETGGGGEVVVATMMGGSNVSIFVRQGGFAAPGCMGGGTLSAVVDANGIVTTFLNSVFVGGVQLPDVAAWKGTGKIGIQLQTVNAVIDNFSGGAP